MKIVDFKETEEIVSKRDAERFLELNINNYIRNNTIYVVYYEGELISFSGKYYKFAYKTLGDLRRALTIKFGKEMTEAMIEEGIIEIYEVQL